MKKILKFIIGYLLLWFIGANIFAIDVPFISSQTANKDNINSVQVNINGKSWTLNISDLWCLSININNWRLNCIKEINGEKVIVDSLQIAEPISVYWNNTLMQNIALSLTVNGESYSTQIQRISFAIFSDYTYQIDWHNPNDFVTKTELKEWLNNIENKLSDLENNYIQKKQLSAIPLNKNNEYCDPSNDDDCDYSYVKFLKKDPITWKVNLDLLINYGN